MGETVGGISAIRSGAVRVGSIIAVMNLECDATITSAGGDLDAADAVDFAIYAIQEAEYALLQAAVDRDTADDLQS